MFEDTRLAEGVVGESCLRILGKFERDQTGGWRMSFIDGGEDSLAVIDSIAVRSNLLSLSSGNFCNGNLGTCVGSLSRAEGFNIFKSCYFFIDECIIIYLAPGLACYISEDLRAVNDTVF